MADFIEYKIVPVEATEEMAGAFHEATKTAQVPQDYLEAFNLLHSATLNAAPPPGEDLVERVAFDTYPKDEKGFYEDRPDYPQHVALVRSIINEIGRGKQ